LLLLPGLLLLLDRRLLPSTLVGRLPLLSGLDISPAAREAAASLAAEKKWENSFPNFKLGES